MAESPAPARRLSDEARRKLNELLARGIPLAKAMQQVSAEPGAFQEVPATPPKAPEAALSRPAWKGDSTEWGPVAEKLQRLRDLDRGCTVFGANQHGYTRKPTVSERQIAAYEKKIRATLPAGLRSFYLTIGNGGAGPGYGMYALEDLKRHHPAKPYPGIAALRAARGRDAPLRENPLQATIPPSRLTGLLAVLTHGCGIYAAVVCTGDVGRVVHFDEDGLAETDDTLVDTYTHWLDEEISRFELVQRLLDASASLDDMEAAMRKLLPEKEAFRAKFEVEAKQQGLTAKKT